MGVLLIYLVNLGFKERFEGAKANGNFPPEAIKLVLSLA
jgi:hypothetical protein